MDFYLEHNQKLDLWFWKHADGRMRLATGTELALWNLLNGDVDE